MQIAAMVGSPITSHYEFLNDGYAGIMLHQSITQCKQEYCAMKPHQGDQFSPEENRDLITRNWDCCNDLKIRN